MDALDLEIKQSRDEVHALYGASCNYTLRRQQPCTPSGSFARGLCVVFRNDTLHSFSIKNDARDAAESAVAHLVSECKAATAVVNRLVRA